MCYVIAAGALCAVFTPVPAHADTPLPPAAAHARPAAQPAPQLAVIPAAEAAGEASVVRPDLPEGRRGRSLPGDALTRPAAETRAAPLELTGRSAYTHTPDTEAKASSYESGEASDGTTGDIERK